MKFSAFAPLLFAASVVTSSPGYAASVIYSIAGTVSAVSDASNYFDQSLVGQSFTSKLTFDLDGASIGKGAGSTSVGNSTGQTMSPGNASFTIGSSTYSLILDYYTIQTEAGGNSIVNANSAPNANSSIAADYLYLQLISDKLSDGISPLSSTAVSSSIAQYGHALGNGGDYARLFLTPTSLQITTDVSAVPLPASAPMFGAALLSLAGLGYAAKRKKVAAAA